MLGRACLQFGSIMATATSAGRAVVDVALLTVWSRVDCVHAMLLRFCINVLLRIVAAREWKRGQTRVTSEHNQALRAHSTLAHKGTMAFSSGPACRTRAEDLHASPPAVIAMT